MILKGKKVVLRPLSLKDAPRFYRWLADKEVTKFLAVYYEQPPTLKEEQEWIKKVQKDKTKQGFAIDAIDGQHIGVAIFDNIDEINQRAEYSIFIGDKKYWGQGCGTEAGKLMVEYGFKKMKLHRMYLYLIAYNVRGRKSYERIGFKFEGRQRDHYFRDGFWHDRILMGLLREEYLKNNKESRVKN